MSKNSSQFLKSIAESGNNLIFNKNVAQQISPEAAIVLAELIAEYCLWDKNNQLTKDGFFFCTESKLKNVINRGLEAQNKIIDKLVENHLLIKEIRGEPKKRYFKLNLKCIESIYSGRKI